MRAKQVYCAVSNMQMCEPTLRRSAKAYVGWENTHASLPSSYISLVVCGTPVKPIAQFSNNHDRELNTPQVH